MAPGLSGHQTGTVPKKKSKSNGSQSHRQYRDTYSQSSSLDWEPMSDLGNKKPACNNKSSTHSEVEGDSDVGRSRSSTLTSQNENEENYVATGLTGKTKSCDRKQVVSKLSQIQSYLQQTADLMSAIKSSESGSNDAGDSSSRRMQKFTRIVTENYGPIMCTSNGGPVNAESVEEELSRRSEESRKKLEALQKRKQDLLKLQDKAKKQLQEAQAEQSRLVARASTLNQELSSSKLLDFNVQHLNRRLKAVQQMYNTRNQISESLNDSRKGNGEGGSEHLDDDQLHELSDPETDYQLVADKMEELNAMKVQLGEIQKMMASINGIPNGDVEQHPREFSDEGKENSKHNYQNSVCSEEGESRGEEASSNAVKLEQAKSKLNHLTQLLDIVQTAQNANGLSPPYLQFVSNLVNEEAESSTPSPTPSTSAGSPQKNRGKISLETMQVMARELEETTAAMKEERDKLEAARQELQNMAKRLPLTKSRGETLSPNEDSESEPPCLKSASLESSFRDILNMSGSTEPEQTSKCNEAGGSGPYLGKRLSFRNLRHQQQHQQQHNGIWNVSSNSSTQERQSKNESLSRSSNLSSRNGSRNVVREPRWSPAPSVTYCSERSNPALQTQNQLEMSSNLCEMALSESGIRPGEISLQGMFTQHQLLTRTVAQCSQLLWLQQKQIIELRNALMLQNGCLPNFGGRQMCPVPSNVSSVGNVPQGPFPGSTVMYPNPNPYLPPPYQSHPNYQPSNEKLNGRDAVQSTASQDPYLDQMIHPLQQAQRPLHPTHPPTTAYPMPDSIDFDLRMGNFARLNLPMSNQNQSGNMAPVAGGRVPNGLNCPPGPEEAGALNNQVPPGNRANNYWDNFRSYSRQNLLSNSKSNEDSETSRRGFTSSGLDRYVREPGSSLQNNQAGTVSSQHPQQHQQLVAGNNHGHSESSPEPFLLPASQNCQSQSLRSRPMECARTQAKNESRHQGNDSRALMGPTNKKESGAAGGTGASGGCSSSGGARSRHTDPGPDNIRSLRNDVGPSPRADNLTNSRNRNQSSRDHDNEEVAQGINKRRLERIRGRKETTAGNLNNRGYYNTSLWENISSEVSSFIRTNETRPHFLIQLFRDLQQVTTDNLRQRTLQSIEETVTANNLMERPNGFGGNVNLVENRNNHANNHHHHHHHHNNNNNNNNSNNNNQNNSNVRENRSNLNRNQGDDPGSIDELFCHLRENQNTIRQNIGMSSFASGGNNLENPNISNIRDLVNSRNNLENDGLRDLRTYFEANLCNFGGNHSALENPNVSNIRENLTRRPPGSDYENVNPKNVYLSMYDNAAVETRRRNLDQASSTMDLDSFRIFEMATGYRGNGYVIPSNDSTSNTHYELEPFQERHQYSLENIPPGNLLRLPILDGGMDLGMGDSTQFLPNANDSGIDINFNSDERKRSFEGSEGPPNDGGIKPKKNVEVVDPVPDPPSPWPRNSARDNSYESPSFISLCENSFFNCRSFQELENGELAEADQSRNDGTTSGAESDGGFILPQIPDTEPAFAQSHQSSESNFSGQNVPESERNFHPEFHPANGSEGEAASGVEESLGFANSASEPEGNFPRPTDSSENLRKSETSEGYYYQLNGTSSSESGISKYGRKRGSEEAGKETVDKKKGGGTFHENSFKKCNGGELEGEKESMGNGPSHSLTGGPYEDRKRTERESGYVESFPFGVEMNGGGEKGNTSPEAESDWECGSGLDQVPTRLKKSGSSRKSDDSGGSIF